MKVICEDCKESFELNQLKQKALKGEIRETYYSCQHCNKKYRVCITNEAIRKLQKKIEEKKLIIRVKSKKGIKNIKEVFELNRLIEKHKKEMNKLNNKSRYESQI
ncbi:MAG: hypothetical protein MJA82_15035 [Clostridia bacterium]|nr:hypothetical protein [Clostridia bacterium]